MKYKYYSILADAVNLPKSEKLIIRMEPLVK